MRKGWGRWEWLYITLCIVAVIISLPVMLPVAMIQHTLAERRKKRRVLVAPCVRCGVVLGTAALERASAEWAAHMEKLFREHPGIHFRMVCELQAVCLACEQAHKYDEKADAFVAVAREWPYKQASEPGGG